MSLRAIDCHGFGGGFTLGVVQAGFELQAKFSREVGFGVYNTLANRQLLGQGWHSYASDPALWERMDADLVFGNPPCSGFSTLSNAKFRGTDSKINDYMWELINYAGRVAPPIVAWESVQTTFRQGLELMRQLRARLEDVSGYKYTLYHVLHNNLSHGGVSMRKRYFFVAARIPFGVDLGRVDRDGRLVETDHVPTLADALRDLAPLGLTMANQVYPTIQMVGDERVRVMNSSTWAQREMHSGSGVVDGHDIAHAKSNDRALEVFEYEGTEWKPGERLSDVLQRFYAEHGYLPKGWYYPSKIVDPDTGEVVITTKAQRLVDTQFNMGYSQPVRWHGDRPANVITGGGAHGIIHPWLNRFFTHRELARIQGFPDDWRIWPVRAAPDVGPAWGKGVPVQAGRWVARWARAALEGSPGPMTGVPLEAFHKKEIFKQFGSAEREYVIDTTYAFRDLQPALEIPEEEEAAAA